MKVFVIGRSRVLRTTLSVAMLVASMAMGVPAAGAATVTSDVHGIPGLTINAGDTMTRTGASGVNNNYYEIQLDAGDKLDVVGAWGDAPGGSSLGINVFGPDWSAGMDADWYGNPVRSIPATAVSFTAPKTGAYNIAIVWDSAISLTYQYAAIVTPGGEEPPTGLEGGASKSTATAITEFPATLASMPATSSERQFQVYKADLADGDTLSLGGSGIGSATGSVFLYDSTKDPIPDFTTFNDGALAIGTFSGIDPMDPIQYTVPEGAGGTYYLCVDFTAAELGDGFYFMATKVGAPEVTFEPLDLAFDVYPGGPAVSKTVTITVSGWESPTVDWSIDVTTSDMGNWLSVTPTGGVAPGTTVMTVTVDPAEMTSGTLDAAVQVFVDSPVAPGGMGPMLIEPTAELPVQVNVQPVMSVNPSKFEFTQVAGRTFSAIQSMTVDFSEDDALNWTVTSESDLASCSPALGVGDSGTNLWMSSPTTRPVGVYETTLTVTPEGDKYDPVQVPVQLNVTAREVTITATSKLTRSKWLSTTSRPVACVEGTVSVVPEVLIDSGEDLTDSQLVAGAPVLIEASTNGTTWSRVGTATVTATDGVFAWTGYITRQTQFRARAVASTFTAGCDPVAAGAALKPYAYVSTPSMKTTVYRYRSFSILGKVYPNHTSASSPVRLSFQRYENNRWRSKFSVNTTRKTSSSTYTNWARTQKMSQRGKWRVRAYHADADHLTTYSSWRYFTVR